MPDRVPTLAELELEFRRQILIDRLTISGGVAAVAARTLGISLRTFERHAEACQWLQPVEPTTTSMS